MSEKIGTYSFLPWMRQGIANRITSADGDTSVIARPEINIELALVANMLGGGETESLYQRRVSLYGPGDVVGVERRAIIREEPKNWITNFEPNYLPFIEFYDEDLPWRYSPAAPDTTTGRLRPWLTLAVLAENEFTEGRMAGRPLPYVEIDNPADTLPDADTLWAFAHIHVNGDLVKTLGEDPRSADVDALAQRLDALIASDADRAYSRLISPRKLLPNLRYHAFLIPTFEVGRLAGLGKDPESVAGVHASMSAWAAYGARPAGQEFPYYHRWQFRTGARGDFEYLVRLLKSRPAPPLVGRREVDLLAPGSGVRPINDPDLGGVLRFSGALQTPIATMPADDRREVEKYDNWAQSYPHPFQSDLAALVNLADDYQRSSVEAAHSGSTLSNAALNDPDANAADDPDPLITAPLYGRWHALTARLLEQPDGSSVPYANHWVHDLNLDPRWRSAAGLGTTVMQANQENYMDAAWAQVGDIVAANRKLRQAQLAKAASGAIYRKHLQGIAARSSASVLAITAPVHSRIVASEITVTYQLRESLVPPAMTSIAMRRVMRRGTPLARRSQTADEPVAALDTLIERVNDGTLTLEPDPQSSEVTTVDDIADAASSILAPGAGGTIPRLAKILLIAAAVVLLIGLLLGPLLIIALLVVAGLVARALQLIRHAKQADVLYDLRSVNQSPDLVVTLPEINDFTLLPIFVPGMNIPPVTTGGSDSVEAARFKTALADALGTVAVAREAGKPLILRPLEINLLAQTIVQRLNPAITIPRRIYQIVTLPPLLLSERPEYLEPVMAYPEFDTPMYEPLLQLSIDNFVPNLGLIRENSITLLETNQRFIESYLVGLNHECARELQWREWPGDMRGSYFRQFWDVSSVLQTAGGDPEVQREKLKDIPPLHRWPINSDLGDHDNREAGSEAEEELVLVIRGELLKKYPSAVIYARRARWVRKPDGSIDRSAERELEDAPDVLSNIKTPLFSAKAPPDIHFLGFDITAEAARGDIGTAEDDDPGWFFVIQERPGEPRFGLDVDRSGQLNVWNDLSWDDVLANPEAGGFVEPSASISALTLIEPVAADVAVKRVQWEEDRFVEWNNGMNAADMAYILYQSPVMVAVHAADMLSIPRS